jgi:hypothetical protein
LSEVKNNGGLIVRGFLRTSTDRRLIFPFIKCLQFVHKKYLIFFKKYGIIYIENKEKAPKKTLVR